MEGFIVNMFGTERQCPRVCEIIDQFHLIIMYINLLPLINNTVVIPLLLRELKAIVVYVYIVQS